MASGSARDVKPEVVEERKGVSDVNKEHLLLEAVKKHNCSLVRELLQNRGQSPDFNIDLNSPVCKAAVFGYVDILDILFEGGCSLVAASKDVWRRQAIHIAASKGHKEFVERLLHYGTDINCSDFYSYTPLHWAAKKGHSDLVEFLISQGAAVNSLAGELYTPLHSAAFAGYNNVIKVLLNHGAEINSSDIEGWAPIHTAVFYGHLEVVKTLIDAGAPLTQTTQDSESVVHIAASRGNIEVLKLLLERHVKLDDLSIFDNTALYLSVKYNQLEIAKYLIKVGADMYIPNDENETPFFLAAKSGYIHFITLFMEAGYDLSREEWILQKYFPQILQKNPELCDLLYKGASNPQKLKDLCKSCIRKSIKFDANFDSRIDQLNLPLHLKNFVSYLALDDIVSHVLHDDSSAETDLDSSN